MHLYSSAVHFTFGRRFLAIVRLVKDFKAWRRMAPADLWCCSRAGCRRFSPTDVGDVPRLTAAPTASSVFSACLGGKGYGGSS